MCALQSNKNFGIEVNFLTGRYVATVHNDRKQAEWPPHTSRLFSAMVSAWAEDGQDVTEREALEWLELQEPPNISASDTACRNTVLCYVPVNDTTIIGDSNESEENAIKTAQKTGQTSPEEAWKLFPEKRKKQERFYPSVTPYDARVTYVWSKVPQDDTAGVLDSLLSRVTRLGHSSSLVSCRVSTDPPTPNYILSRFGESIRAVRRGQTDVLVDQYVRHQGVKRRALPYENARYIKNDSGARSQYLTPNTSGNWVVLRLESDSRFWPSTQATRVAAELRSTILNHMEDPVPEEVSGIGPDGTPATNPHVAFISLPYAGFPHADGRILGIAVSLPRSLKDESRYAVYRAIGRWEDSQGTDKAPDDDVRKIGLKLGSLPLRASRQVGPEPLVSLQQGMWGRESRRWVSVTPISLPKHPGSLGKGSASARASAWRKAESAVMLSCEHVGLPRPLRVVVSHEPFIHGAYPAARYPPFEQKGRGGGLIRRKLVHASITFEETVRGPLMLGTGRFVGLGLMRPV